MFSFVFFFVWFVSIGSQGYVCWLCVVFFFVFDCSCFAVLSICCVTFEPKFRRCMSKSSPSINIEVRKPELYTKMTENIGLRKLQNIPVKELSGRYIF